MLRVHTTEYVEFLETAHARWCAATGNPHDAEAVPYARPIRDQPHGDMPHVLAQLGWYSHDSDPVLEGTWEASTAAVDVALTAWRAVVDADAPDARAYGLCRPPGHHAAADSFAGYCYLNNAAIAAQAWADIGARGRDPRRRLPSRERDPTALLRPRRRALRLVARRSGRRLSVLPRLRLRAGLGRGRGLHAELPAPARHRLGALRTRPRRGDRGRPQVRAGWRGRIPRRRHRGGGSRLVPARRRRLPAHRRRHRRARRSPPCCCRRAATPSRCSAATS